MTGKTETYDNKTQKITIPGFQPAKSYEVSIALLSEKVMSCKPYVFQCQTDPRGESSEHINLNIPDVHFKK